MNKAASEIVVGDLLCEADGFMWQVTATVPTRKMVVLSLAPLYKTILGEKPHSIRAKATTRFRVAETNERTKQ